MKKELQKLLHSKTLVSADCCHSTHKRNVLWINNYIMVLSPSLCLWGTNRKELFINLIRHQTTEMKEAVHEITGLCFGEQERN